MSGPDEHDELWRRLRAADPATSLPPATPERVARLVEDAMTTRETETAPAVDPAVVRRRSPLPWLAAAAAAVVIGGVGAVALLGDDPAPQAGGPDSSTGTSVDADPAGSGSVTELVAPGATAYDARCMVPNAAVLSDKPIAFDGTVVAIDGEMVTLDPTTWFAGDPTDLVEVRAPGPELDLLLTSVAFTEGGRYLVAADESGAVMVCGFTAEWTPELEAIYTEAFATP